MPPPTQEELDEQHKRDTETKHYKWKDNRGVEHERDFTYRDALDRQRDLERQMRNTRAKAMGYKAGGLEEEYVVQRARYRNQTAEYKKFSTAMGIDTNFERIYMDRFRKNIGRIRSGIMVTHVYKGIPVYDDDGNLKYVQPVKGIVADDGKTYKGVLSKDSRGNRFVYNQVPNDYIQPPTPTDPFVSIELTTLPTKMFYNLDDTIDLSGGILTATRQSGATTEISLPSYQVRIISGAIVDTPLIHTIELAFNGLTTSFKVGVQAVFSSYNIFGNTIQEKIYKNMVSANVSDWEADSRAVINSRVNGVINFTANAQYGNVYYRSLSTVSVGKKYYCRAYVRTTTTNAINGKLVVGATDLATFPNAVSSTTFGKLSAVVTNTLQAGTLKFVVQNSAAFNWSPAECKEMMLVDITDIPEIAGMTDTEVKTWCDANLIWTEDGIKVLNPIPSPEYPVTLNSVGKAEGKLIVRTASRNKFSSTIINGSTSSSTGIVNPGQANRLTTPDLIKISPNINHVLNALGVDAAMTFYFDENKNIISTLAYGNLPRVFTPPPNAEYARFTFRRNDESNISPSDISKVQLEEGSTATDFVEFKEAITPIPIQQSSKDLPNGVRDDLDDKNVAKEILDGTENWILNAVQGNIIRFELTFPSIALGYKMVISNKFIQTDAITYANINYECIASHPNSHRINIFINKSRLETEDVTGFKIWLTENNITVQYQLAEPTQQNITRPKIPYFGVAPELLNEVTGEIQYTIDGVLYSTEQTTDFLKTGYSLAIDNNGAVMRTEDGNLVAVKEGS